MPSFPKSDTGNAVLYLSNLEHYGFWEFSTKNFLESRALIVARRR